MTTSEFYRQIKALNPRLRICDFGGNGKLAGLYILGHYGEDYFDICGVDKEYVPEYTEWDSQGHIVKSGWRRVFLILLQLGLTDIRTIQKVCPGFFLHWRQSEVDADRAVKVDSDPIANKMLKMAESAPIMQWRNPDTGETETGTSLTIDQNLELAEDIRKKDSSQKREQDAHDRWFLETWKKRGGNSSDKPNY